MYHSRVKIVVQFRVSEQLTHDANRMGERMKTTVAATHNRAFLGTGNSEEEPLLSGAGAPSLPPGLRLQDGGSSEAGSGSEILASVLN